MPALPPFRRLLIVGTGLIGTSVGLAARRAYPDLLVGGYDTNPGRAFAARNAGAVTDVPDDLDTAAGESDLIVLAAPILASGVALAEIADVVSPQAILTDTLSVKRAICRVAEEVLEHPGRFVGAHPMAGGEQSGPGAARVDLFDGAACFITPTDLTDDDAAEKVEAFWTALGCRVSRTYASHHDRLVAQMSHLPHVLAAALVRLPEDVALQFVGRGFRDTTRIAAGNAELWADILLANADEVMLALRESVDDLRTMAGLLERGHDERADLVRWLADAADRRRALDAPVIEA